MTKQITTTNSCGENNQDITISNLIEPKYETDIIIESSESGENVDAYDLEETEPSELNHNHNKIICEVSVNLNVYNLPSVMPKL